MSDDAASPAEETPTRKRGFWGRLKDGLGKTRSQLATGVGNLILGEREIDDSVLEDLETSLLMTDVGVEATQAVMQQLSQQVQRKELNNTTALHKALAELLKNLLQPLATPFAVDPAARPFVVFFVGVNGAGKTTTVGKIANRLKAQGQEVVLAAGDTFRAAAVEQLQTWGERNGVVVVAQHQGADSASVVFDAVQSGKAKGVDVVLVDTAGRLQAKSNLMDELSKVKRVVSKIDAATPHEVILVLDAGIGQNAISQARLFDEAVGVTGYVITKLDGSAKAGVIFAIASQLPKPVYFVGVGESIEDLQPFSPADFVDALLAQD